MIHDMHQKKKTLTKQNKRIICKLDDLAATTARLFFQLWAEVHCTCTTPNYSI